MEGIDMRDSAKLRIISMIIVTTLLGSLGSGLLVSVPLKSNGLMGPADAYVEGNVKNGTSGIKVEIFTWDNTTEPPVRKYFNTTTGAAGHFNRSVDSDPAHLAPYEIRIFRTYYRDVVREFYTFEESINSSTAQIVPYGELEVTPAPIGDLRVTILNETSGDPLEGVRVDIDHLEEYPPIPFPTANGTDSNGKVLYHSILAVNTTISGSLQHFRSLEASNDENWAVVGEGGITDVVFYLKENPWPFTTNPTDGSTDVDVSRNITIDFKEAMNTATTEDIGNYMITRVDNDEMVNFTAGSHSLGKIADLDPEDDLVYNTTYRVRLDIDLSTELGGHPLWRAMEFEFTTELRPGRVMGRVVDNIDNSGIPYVSMKIRDTITLSNATGHFLFEAVTPGDHSLQIDESYLYQGSFVEDITVDKGMDVDLHDILLERMAWGSLNVSVVSDHGPVSGAWVAVKDSTFNGTTDESGRIRFDRTRVGKVTVTAGAPHHNSILDQAFVEQNSTGFLNIELIEDDLPVTVIPTKIIGDSIVDPGTFFNITMPGEIDRDTLDVSIRVLNDTGIPAELIPILPITIGGSLDYTVKTVSPLPLERSFVLIINDTLEYSTGASMLWRDLEFGFSTPVLPLSYVTGAALLEGRPLEGLIVEFDGFQAEANSSGGFNITVDLSLEKMTSTLFISANHLGYEDYGRNLTLDAGAVFDAGEISLIPLSGWYGVLPGDGAVGVSPETNITFTFVKGISEPEGGFSNYLSVMPAGSNAPLSGTYEAMAGNTSVVFQPDNPLEEGGEYIIRASPDLRFVDGGLVCPVGKETSFTVRFPTVEVSLLEPDSSTLDDAGIDLRMVLSFGLDVDRSSVEASISILPSPLSVTFTWASDSEVRLDLFLESDSDYTLTVPPGSYGTNGEMLNSAFNLAFSTGSHYDFDHTEISFSINPDPEGGYRPNQEVRLNGFIENSSGYEVKLTIEGTGKILTYNSTVGEDGSWELIFQAPNMTGEITMTLAIGIPGEVSAVSDRTWSVDLLEEGDDGGEDGTSQSLILAIVLIVVVLIVVVIIALIMTKRNREAMERSEDIEYSDVDMEIEE